MGRLIGVQVKNSTTQSKATNVALGFDQEDFDDAAYHDTVTNNTRLTVPSGQAGRYLVIAFVKSNGTITAGKYIAYIQKNGADLPGAQQDSAALAAGGVQLTVSAFAVMAATDYVEVKVSSAGTTTWDTACRFGMYRIG